MDSPPEPQPANAARPTGTPSHVKVEVRCRRCGYDLRGLSVESRCPECGLDVWISLTHIVDPTASRMPRLCDSVGVGNALLWLVVCGWLVSVLLSVHALLLRTAVAHPRGVVVIGANLPADLLVLAAVVLMLALWSPLKFAPPRGKEPEIAVRMDVWVLGIALAGLGLLTMLLWHRERMWQPPFAASPADVQAARSSIHLAMAIVGTGAWFGLRGILQTIGRRSRLYRQARQGRQNIRPMLAATLGVATGSLVRILAAQIGVLAPAATIGTIIVWVAMLMLVIGQTYLLVNVWWIRQSLRHPPPRLEDLVAGSLARPGQAPDGAHVQRR
jgi:hypothetical protein